jgi:hypothetical protein
MEQQSPRYEPIILENESSDSHLKNSFANKASLYGITEEQFMELAEKQGFKCGSCEEDATGMVQTLHVDHCHDTLEIRGLLCGGCNTASGWLHDDPKKAEALAHYLRTSGTGLYTSLKPKLI